MRILFLNQYFPPDPAPTGVLFREIADDFSRFGHTVDFVDAGQTYRDGHGGGGRMKREFQALWRMLREGRARPKADVVISGTSPPCLAVVADRVARKHRAAHIHWAMDVYPEIAIELGEVGRGSMVGRVAGWAMRRAYRGASAIVALDSDMADRIRLHGVEPVSIRPWVPQRVIAAMGPDSGPQSPWTWIYSGNLGRAHEWETLLRAQALLEARGVDARLLFQGGGPACPGAQARALEIGLRRCEWRGYVAEEELPASLLRCDVLTATQLASVRGLLWPSKLGLLMSLPRPIVFVGPPDGAIGAEVRGLAHGRVFAPGDGEGLARWIEVCRKARMTVPASAVTDPRANREAVLSAWRDLLTRVRNRV